MQAVTLLKTDATISTRSTTRRSSITSGGVTSYEWEIAFPELVLGDKIGDGSTARAYQGTWKGSVVSIKLLKINMTAETVEEFKKEVRTLCKLRHPNVVKSYY